MDGTRKDIRAKISSSPVLTSGFSEATCSLIVLLTARHCTPPQTMTVTLKWYECNLGVSY